MFADERSPSPPSDRSSPTERIPSMINMVYDTMPDAFGNHQQMNTLGSLAAAQQQLKTRSKMHEMAVKQRLITDQVFVSLICNLLSLEISGSS